MAFQVHERQLRVRWAVAAGNRSSKTLHSKVRVGGQQLVPLEVQLVRRFNLYETQVKEQRNTGAPRTHLDDFGDAEMRNSISSNTRSHNFKPALVRTAHNLQQHLRTTAPGYPRATRSKRSVNTLLQCAAARSNTSTLGSPQHVPLLQQPRSIAVDGSAHFGFGGCGGVCNGGSESLLGAVACSKPTLYAPDGDTLNGFSLVGFAGGHEA